MQPTQPQPWRDILGGRTSVVTCSQQVLRVAKPVAALQIVKERLAVATTEGEGVRVCAVGENGKTRQMKRESISMHCALQQWTVKGTDYRHQPSAQDMDAKPVATRPEARVAAQTQGWVLGNRIWQPLGDLCAGPWDQKHQQQRGDGRPVVAVTACYALGPLGRVLAEHLGSTSRQRDDFF